ncbi:MAG: guanylate kinase [Microcoleaceae cyanobacterium]
MRTGQLIVLTGPSGVGKGTLVQSLLQRHPQLNLSVSITTRSPRPGEIDGVHYYFVDRDRFKEMVNKQELLEWAEFAGNYYGTPLQPVLQKIKTGDSVLLEIELHGARQVRKTFPQGMQIFILPPSLAELERRIRERGKDSEAAMICRLQRAEEEILAKDEFDFVVVNDDFDRTLKQLEEVMFAVA